MPEDQVADQTADPGQTSGAGQVTEDGDQVTEGAPRPHRVRRGAAVLGTACACAVAGTLAGAVVFPAAHIGHSSTPFGTTTGPLLPSPMAAATSPAAPACQHTVLAPGSPAPLCVNPSTAVVGSDGGGISTTCLQGCAPSAGLPVTVGSSAPAAAPATAAAPPPAVVPTAQPAASPSGSTGATPPKSTALTCTSIPASQAAALLALVPSLVKAVPGKIVTVKVAGATVRVKVGKSGLQLCGGRLPSLPKLPSSPTLPGVPPVPVSGGGNVLSLGDLPIPGL